MRRRPGAAGWRIGISHSKSECFGSGETRHTLANVWAALDQEVGPGCVAIIGITGADDHWCVVYRVTPKTLRLLDSAGRSCIRRSRCTVRTSSTRYCLELGEILLIER